MDRTTPPPRGRNSTATPPAGPDPGPGAAAFTLRGLILRWPVLLPVALLVPFVLGLLAMVDGGRLLVWDAAVADTVAAHRTAWADQLALAVSRLGSWVVVFPAGAALAALASRRSRPLALAIVVVVAARPALEWLLKDLVARPRPAGDRLVAGTGFSYPSGHVLAAAATWAFLPAVVALYTHRRALWWAAAGAATTLVAAMAWCRVWLGVHWASDVTASLALSFVAFAAVGAWLHRRGTLDAPALPVPAATDGDAAGGGDARRPVREAAVVGVTAPPRGPG